MQSSSATVALASTATKATVDLTPASLTFTAANWNTTQWVDVSVPNNYVVGGSGVETISLLATSTDAAYSNMAGPSITVNAKDDDVVRPPAGHA
mgnify:CR=1 FL=1